jgi:ABC-type multidrug transport system permease subunit
MYRIIAQGSFQADMIVMSEIILTTYVMGYIQVYLLKNFEESDHMGAFELLAAMGCSLFYVGLSYLMSWFDRAWLPELLFFGYMMLCYISIFCIYYVRRHWDTEELNLELEAFKKTRKPKE